MKTEHNPEATRRAWKKYENALGMKSMIQEPGMYTYQHTEPVDPDQLSAAEEEAYWNYHLSLPEGQQPVQLNLQTGCPDTDYLPACLETPGYVYQIPYIPEENRHEEVLEWLITRHTMQASRLLFNAYDFLGSLPEGSPLSLEQQYRCRVLSYSLIEVQFFIDLVHLENRLREMRNWMQQLCRLRIPHSVFGQLEQQLLQRQPIPVEWKPVATTDFFTFCGFCYPATDFERALAQLLLRAQRFVITHCELPRLTFEQQLQLHRLLFALCDAKEGFPDSGILPQEYSKTVYLCQLLQRATCKRPLTDTLTQRLGIIP